MGGMSRKRFCKLLMAAGWSRNAAQHIAAAMKDTPGGYAAAYERIAQLTPQMIGNAARLAGQVMASVATAFGELSAAIAKTVVSVGEWAQQVRDALDEAGAKI